MKKLLHIIATPRNEESRTLAVSKSFLQSFTATHSDWEVDTLNLFETDLPSIGVKQVDGKYTLMSGKNLSSEQAAAWEKIMERINHFLSADGYLLSVPMWNFGIPYPLKHYIDVIAQPRYLFRYTESGPEGLAKGRKMVIVTSRGGDYSQAPASLVDHESKYLKTIFSFFGIEISEFIYVQPADACGEVVRNQKIIEASEMAKKIGETFCETF